MPGESRPPSYNVSEEESRRRRVEFLQLIRGDARLGRLPMSVRAACDCLGIARKTTRYWCETDPDFAADYNDAMEDSTDVLDDEAVRRAMGVVEDVFGKDENGLQVKIGERVRYSDDLLKFVLSGRRGIYGRGVQVNTQVNVVEQISDRDMARALALMVAEERERQA